MKKENYFCVSMLIITVTPPISFIASTLGNFGTLLVNGDQLEFRRYQPSLQTSQ
jgi:hypothetical protein